jgi:hypothetical protein
MEKYFRRTVICVGSLVFETRPFEVRNLNLIRVAVGQVKAGLNSARAIIIAEPSGRMGFVRQWVTELKPLAEDYGLRFVLIADSNRQFQVLSGFWKDAKLDDYARIYLDSGIETAAEDIARFDPGPPVGEPKIVTPRLRLSKPMRLLLRRAFSDCEKLYLEPLGGGKAAIGVFCVHAWLKRSEVGPRPLPFFIKFDRAGRIQTERFNYEQYADFFIPFYLRPNIDSNRSVTVRDVSALVGNFVDEARPLRNFLRSNESPGIIFSLFENSLKGFRSQPKDSYTVQEKSLGPFAKDRTRVGEVSKTVARMARKLGLKLSLAELEVRLVSLAENEIRPFTAIHGDLHPGNVMVRGRDAILIDFGSIENGPLTADPSTLEVSLVFGTDASDSFEQFKEWRLFVDEIYKGVPIHQPPLAEKRPGPFTWLRQAVREIRHIFVGCGAEQREASIILAAYLMRFGRLPVEEFSDKNLQKLALLRHSYALVVAERIVRSHLGKA